MNFQNTKEMENIFSQIARDAINDITREMKNRIQEEIDKKEIGTGKGEIYQPTGEFREAWIDEVPKRISSSEYQGEMHYEPYMIRTISPENFIHSSSIVGWEDYPVPEFLPNIIFEGDSGKLFGNGFWTQKRDAWTPMISSMEKSFAKLMRDSFAKKGIKLDTSRTYKSGF